MIEIYRRNRGDTLTKQWRPKTSAVYNISLMSIGHGGRSGTERRARSQAMRHSRDESVALSDRETRDRWSRSIGARYVEILQRCLLSYEI